MDGLCCHCHIVHAHHLRVVLVAGVALIQKDDDIHPSVDGPCCPHCSVHVYQKVTVPEAALVRRGGDHAEDQKYVLLMDGLYYPGYSFHARELIELLAGVKLLLHDEYHLEEHGHNLLVMDGPDCSVHAHQLLEAEAVLLWEDEDRVGDDYWILGGLGYPGYNVRAYHPVVTVLEVEVASAREDANHVDDHEYILPWMDGPG